MPVKSKAQYRYIKSKNPSWAGKEWTEGVNYSDLPDKKAKNKYRKNLAKKGKKK